MIPEIVSQLTADTAYSRENFEWLMNNSAARSYLGKDTVAKILDALEKGDDEFLKGHFERIRNNFITEKDINLKQALREELVLAEFETEAEETGKYLKDQSTQFMHKMEDMDSNYADSILDNLNNTN